MARPHPGWLVVLFAAGLSMSSWLPWLTTSADGGGRASPIGGTLGSITLPARFGAGQLLVLSASVLIVLGAMVARNVSRRPAAIAAAVVSVVVVALTWWYVHVNVVSPVGVGYGFYLGAACAAGVLVCSMWALLTVLQDH